jgi:hypothetical protein
VLQQNYDLKRANAGQAKFDKTTGRLIVLKIMNKLTCNQFLHSNDSLTSGINEICYSAFDYKNNLWRIIIK